MRLIPYLAEISVFARLRPNSWTITARVAMDHLEALGCSLFDVGVRRLDGKMLLREGWSSRQVLKSLLWLRRENFHSGHIYVRPFGVHDLSLVDDLTADAVASMKVQGYEPAAVIETSPRNFQVWLRHGHVLDEVTSTRAAKALARRFGGDLSSADWRHFGRLAGFTNPKRERQLPSGIQPFARLIESSGCVYSQAVAFITEVRATLQTERFGEVGGADRRVGQGSDAAQQLRSLKDFHEYARYCGDLHRADLAWANHAAAAGLSAADIENQLMRERDLSKKGNAKQQREYAKRTAEKACRAFR
jgi:RepB DNA-primase from phage plasmid